MKVAGINSGQVHEFIPAVEADSESAMNSHRGNECPEIDSRELDHAARIGRDTDASCRPAVVLQQILL